MLVLSRRVNQSIRFILKNVSELKDGDIIEVTYLSPDSPHESKALRLGIIAPKSVQIIRPEKHSQ